MKTAFLFFTFLPFLTFAQLQDTAKLGFAKKLQQFIPEGFEVLDVERGKINTDNLEDAVLILRSKVELIGDSLGQQEWLRPLLIFYQQKDKSYTLKTRTDSLILCQTCGGMMMDAYDGMEIKNHTLRFYFNGGLRIKWTRNIHFIYDPKQDDLVLIKDEENSYDSFNEEPQPGAKSRLTGKTVTIKNYRVKWE